jgi:Neuraminidase (sialidase)
MATNYQPQKISTTAIDYVIGQIDDITDAIGMAYTQEGHNFYMLTFPRGNRSICFDLTTGYWHERAYFDESTSVQGRHLANYMSFFDGRTICGDYRNGNTYELDLDTCTDNGGTIVRERTCAHVHSDRKRLYYKEFEIDCERGTGDQDGQGEAPQVFLQTSDDGGYNWSSEKWATFGKVGKYKTRMRWQRLGKSRDRVFRIKASDPVKMIILGARMDVESDL